MILEQLKDNKYRELIIEDIIEVMLKGGNSLELAQALLYILYSYYKEDYNSEYIENRVLEVHERLLEDNGYRKGKRNIQGEVTDAVAFRGSSGTISLNDIYLDLKATDQNEKTAVRMAINRMVFNRQLEKVSGGRSGIYRVINSNAAETTFLTTPKGEYKIWLPLELHTMCKVFPKNIVMVAGSKSSGKTALLLNIALANQDKHKVIYLNSEMGDEEFTDRMIKLGCNKPEDIRFKCYHKASDYQDLVNDDNAIYIIDFLEIHDEFYKIGKHLKAIHDKLKDGIAIIAVQMKSGGNLGRGGDFSKEVSRLYLSMDYDPAMKCTRVGIEEMKSPKTQPGFRGWHRYVKIIEGSRLSPMGAWTDAIEGYSHEKKASVVGR